MTKRKKNPHPKNINQTGVLNVFMWLLTFIQIWILMPFGHNDSTLFDVKCIICYILIPLYLSLETIKNINMQMWLYLHSCWRQRACSHSTNPKPFYSDQYWEYLMMVWWRLMSESEADVALTISLHIQPKWCSTMQLFCVLLQFGK